ncbi:hypothetical protein EYR40_002735 [Pleurotus pulmonarius]|nr:hypothetical protein EYR40_002735 [Pleurotus pulmonarius]KAF4582414.1 hypothetical protein EYR38_002534 [Pleurotus pulmonarius]
MSPLGVALVTGAGRGIGRAIALRLAQDGYDLALSDLHVNQALVETLATEIKNRGRKYTIVPANVKYEAEVKGMVGRTVKELGSLDVMIANAGIVSMKPFLDVEAEDWDEVQAVNSRGTFLCYKYAAKQMVDQGRGGRIIGASSLAGKQGWSHLTAYSSSKFTIRGLTQAAGRWITIATSQDAQSSSSRRVSGARHHGQCIFARYRGHKDEYVLITTSRLQIFEASNLRSDSSINNSEQILGDASGDPEGFFKGYTDRVPVRRFGTSDEVAGLVSYLVSKEASYITGQSVSINGGVYCD